MMLKPEVTVAALVERDGLFLLVEERIRGRLVLNQPSGHVEDRETLLNAVIRETREETAYGFEPQQLLGTYLWRNPRTGVSTLRFAFIGCVTTHDPAQALDAPVERALWLPLHEIAAAGARLRNPLVMRSLEDFQSGRRFPLDSIASLDLETASHIRAVKV